MLLVWCVCASLSQANPVWFMACKKAFDVGSTSYGIVTNLKTGVDHKKERMTMIDLSLVSRPRAAAESHIWVLVRKLTWVLRNESAQPTLFLADATASDPVTTAFFFVQALSS